MTDNPKSDNTSKQSPEDRQHVLDLKRYTVEKITLFFLFLYVSIAGYQGCEMKKSVDVAHDTYVAANRPYVGPEGISLTYLRKDANGNTVVSKLPTVDTYQVDFAAGFKNFGAAPANNVHIDWDVRFDGNPIQISKIPDLPSIMYPTQTVSLPGTMPISFYNALKRGEKTLIIKVFCDYDGLPGHSHVCEKYQFAQDVNGFYNLGACE